MESFFNNKINSLCRALRDNEEQIKVKTKEQEKVAEKITKKQQRGQDDVAEKKQMQKVLDVKKKKPRCRQLHAQSKLKVDNIVESIFFGKKVKVEATNSRDKKRNKLPYDVVDGSVLIRFDGFLTQLKTAQTANTTHAICYLENLRVDLEALLKCEISQTKEVENEKPEAIKDLLRLIYLGSLFDTLPQNQQMNHRLGYVTVDEEDDLKEISDLANLLISGPTLSQQHQDSFQACLEHSKLWLDRPLLMDLRVKLDKIN